VGGIEVIVYKTNTAASASRPQLGECGSMERVVGEKNQVAVWDEGLIPELDESQVKNLVTDIRRAAIDVSLIQSPFIHRDLVFEDAVKEIFEYYGIKRPNYFFDERDIMVIFPAFNLEKNKKVYFLISPDKVKIIEDDIEELDRAAQSYGADTDPNFYFRRGE